MIQKLKQFIFKNYTIILPIFFILFSLTLNFSAHAGALKNYNETREQADAFSSSAGFDKSVLIGPILAGVVKGFFGLLGVIFLGYIIYAGYKWMTAEGDEEEIKQAQKTIKNAIIGLIIIASAYAITSFIFSKLDWVSGGSSGGTSEPL